MRDMLSLTFATGSSRKRATTSGPTFLERSAILNPEAISLPFPPQDCSSGLPLLAAVSRLAVTIGVDRRLARCDP